MLEREGGEVHWSYSTGSEPVKSSPCVDACRSGVGGDTQSHPSSAGQSLRRGVCSLSGPRAATCYSSPVPNPKTGVCVLGTHGGDLLSVSGRSEGSRMEDERGGQIFYSPALPP